MSEFEKSEKMEKEKIGKETALVSPVGCRTEMMMNLRLWMVALFLLAAIGLLGGCAQSSGDADPDTEDDTSMMDDMDDDDMDDMDDMDEDMVEEETPDAGDLVLKSLQYEGRRQVCSRCSHGGRESSWYSFKQAHSRHVRW